MGFRAVRREGERTLKKKREREKRHPNEDRHRITDNKKERGHRESPLFFPPSKNEINSHRECGERQGDKE